MKIAPLSEVNDGRIAGVIISPKPECSKMNEIDISKSQSSLMLSADDIRKVAGLVSDLTAAAILAMQPTKQDLLVAVYFASGQGDLVDRAGHELSGKAAQIFDILKRDELYLEEEQ